MEATTKWFEQNGFTLDEVLHHQEIIPFIKTYLFKRNFFTLSYLILNLIFLLALLSSVVLKLNQDTISLSTAFLWFSYGCALTFALVPVHEGLHAIAYKMCGAPNVSFAANWKQLYFMAVADKFIARRIPFYFIGSLPFVTISLILIYLSVYFSGVHQVMFLTILLFHASMCAGDFGLMSYFAQHPGKEVATYDDHQNSLTYFFIK